MATVLKKKQFKDDGTGRLIVKAHIEPKTADSLLTKLEDGIDELSSTNEAVALVEQDTTDDQQNRMIIEWVGPGETTIRAAGDADLDAGETRTVEGFLDLKLEDDEAEIVEIVLDLEA